MDLPSQSDPSLVTGYSGAAITESNHTFKSSSEGGTLGSFLVLCKGRSERQMPRSGDKGNGRKGEGGCVGRVFRKTAQLAAWMQDAVVIKPPFPSPRMLGSQSHWHFRSDLRRGHARLGEVVIEGEVYATDGVALSS